jgi:hypothetical protein
MKFTTDGEERKSYYQMTKAKGFVCFDEMLSYNKTTNIVLGQRSYGKSTAAALKLLTDWILQYERDKEHPAMFTYVRVTDIDLKKSKKGYFSPIETIMQSNGWGKDWYIDCRGEEFYMVQTHKEVDDKGKEYEAKEECLCGYCIALNLQGSQKSGKDFAYCKWELIEEFVPDKKEDASTKTAKFHDYFNLFMSMNRMPGSPYKNYWGLRCILLGNNSTYNCDIYKKMGISKYLRVDTHWLRPKKSDWILWQMDGTDAKKVSDEALKSQAYRMTAEDEDEMNFAFYNKAAEVRSESFIMKDDSEKVPYISFIYEGKKYGVWISGKKDYEYYVNHKTASFVPCIALTNDDRSINAKFIKDVESAVYWNNFISAVTAGEVRFADWQCKSAIDNFQKWV